MTKPTVWTEPFRVRSYETDPGGTASIQTICNYLQEVAGNHATALGVAIEQLAERDLTWFLARLRVEMDTLPAWREDVIVETWPSGVDRLFATREFLLRTEDGAPIGRASSAWLMFDRRRRRPIRMPEFITALEVADRPRPMSHVPGRLPDVHDGAPEQHVRVRYSDLDVNGHVNNVRYAEWSVESVPRPIVEERIVRKIDLHFRSEGNYGDVVTVRTERIDEPDGDPNGDPTFGHVVEHDGRELARVRTVWTER